MHRILQIGSMLLLVAGVSLGRNRQAPKDAHPPQVTQKVAPAKAGQPKAGNPKGQPIPKGAARVVNPGSVAARLFRMSPEEREHALEKLPNEKQRENARALLAWFDGLPKEQQEMQLRRLDRFAQLPPEKRAEARDRLMEFNALPPPRKVLVQRALYRLQEMNDQRRENTMHNPAFEAQFSPDELRIISGLADAWMGPIY